MIFDLPQEWWSRPYEYAWALPFAREGDTALDAACGVCHPFKFALLEKCREVHACDLDERILDPEAIKRDIENDFGRAALESFLQEQIGRLRFSLASVTALPYPDKMFDKIFCLSVLEHLEIDRRKFPPAWMKAGLEKLGGTFPVFNSWLPRDDMLSALKEFARVLKDEGRIILTFDYPSIDLEHFSAASRRSGLVFAGETDFNRPETAIYSSRFDLYCFRAVLKKA